ncbi:hypothetical protein PCANC_06621 [Puccinia coronata f. sp. avenae]|uniref:Conserved oligomeric Golgi complex subunit 1 n=2 Tax=Puccinia coronata f. sp. avenae TaxID=200324 RepID=A0A2N5T024_9BASI|nr:hypothetical protein PCANC_06621 [Puccinia coronata f. sp. avenae]
MECPLMKKSGQQETRRGKVVRKKMAASTHSHSHSHSPLAPHESHPILSTRSSATASPPLRSRHSTRSFTSLAPSDSRSNHPKGLHSGIKQQNQYSQSRISFKPDPFKRSPGQLDEHSRFISSKLSIPSGTRPEDIDLLAIDDPDDLFLNFTIREIRSIEQRARSDADQKREDLRQMVGERYRDLLSAADSIVRMKNSSQNLLERLNHARLESNRNRLISNAQLAGNSHTTSITGSSQLSYILATLLRLLLDLSEHIWRSLEQEDFLTASRYESLGRIISNELTSGTWDESGETEPREVLEMFPIVERQSEALAQLGPQISSRAKLFLRKWQAKNHATMEALAAIILLDTTGLLDSLQLLLQLRKTAFTSLITRLNGSWTELVKSAVNLLLATLENVQQIFLKGELTALLKAVQDGSSKEKHLKPLLSLLPNAHQLMHHIPQSIVNFCPFVAALAGSEHIQAHSITQSWFQSCQLELISYIDKKLNQVHSTQTLVEFRLNLGEMISGSDGPFQPTIAQFGKSILVSLDRRFYELYQTRLDQLRNDIIESLKPRDGGKTRKDIKRENQIFDKKLPVLEPNDPTKFPKYLRSIQNRIEGKFIEEDEDHDHNNRHTPSTEGIVTKLERVGKLLKEDFHLWEENRGPLISEGSQQRSRYLDLGSQFVERCLREIELILQQGMEKSNIENELSVGDLAVQILSTRNSFMVDLSLSQQAQDSHKMPVQSEFIHRFQAGLNHILFLSSTHWAEALVEQSVLLFQSSHLKLAQNSHYFILDSLDDDSELVTRPSEALSQSLELISSSTITELGVHRLKAQQSRLVDALMSGFVLGILNDQLLDFVSRSKLDRSRNQRLLDSLLFDLLFLSDLFLGPRQLSPPSQSEDPQTYALNDARKAINKMTNLILEHEGKEESEKKLTMTRDLVRQFKATITRLWWPIIIAEAPGETLPKKSGLDEDGDGPPGSTLLHTPATAPLVDLKKLHKYAGLRCVKPGNRFTLLSVQ